MEEFLLRARLLSPEYIYTKHQGFLSSPSGEGPERPWDLFSGHQLAAGHISVFKGTEIYHLRPFPSRSDSSLYLILPPLCIALFAFGLIAEMFL